jgi:hypothetical protein
MDGDNGAVSATGLPIEVMTDLSVEQMFSWTVGRNLPVPAAPHLARPAELDNPQAGIRLAYTLQEVLRNTEGPDSHSPGLRRSWKAMSTQLSHVLSDEGKRQLAHTVSDQCPESPQCARLEMTAVYGWLDQLIGELSLEE